MGGIQGFIRFYCKEENLFIHHMQRMLTEFIDEINHDDWIGKERELISRFAFSKLVPNVGCDKVFYDAAQIGIEVRVKQVRKGKNDVCKDLIIWKYPHQTVYSSDNVPLLIMEWKYNSKKPSDYDIDWLIDYTQLNLTCTGIALNIEKTDTYLLEAVLIREGKISDDVFIQC